MADNDNYVDPWPLLDKFAQASPNLDPRAYGGDRNGPTDCNGTHYYYGRTPLGPRDNDASSGEPYNSSSGTPFCAGEAPDCDGGCDE